jgi:predicted acetyltransferase
VELRVPEISEIPEIARIWRSSLSDVEAQSHFTRIRLLEMESNPTRYWQSLNDEIGGGEFELENGVRVERLPSFTRFMWKEGYLGIISFRWQPGTTSLPEHVLGHIGYETFSFAQGKGYATAALRQMLDFPRKLNMPYIEIHISPENLASQRVTLSNGGELIGEFHKPTSLGGDPILRYRITL